MSSSHFLAGGSGPQTLIPEYRMSGETPATTTGTITSVPMTAS